MLFKRYGNPMQLLSTMTMNTVFDYILYIFDEEQDDTLWSIWLNKDIEKDYREFAKELRQPLRTGAHATLKVDEDDVKHNLAEAALIVKPRGKEES